MPVVTINDGLHANVKPKSSLHVTSGKFNNQKLKTMKVLKMMKYFLLASLAIVFFAACNDDDEDTTPTPQPQTIAEIVQGDEQFSTLLSLLEQVDLVSVLDGDGPFTVFAPNNDALDATIAKLGFSPADLSDEDLTEILLYHVLNVRVAAADIQEGKTYVPTAAVPVLFDGGESIDLIIDRSGSSVVLNGEIDVTSTDIEASNGIIHLIDEGLLPLDVVNHVIVNDELEQLESAIALADEAVLTTLSMNNPDDPFTVFAPNNQAFLDIADVVAGLTQEELTGILTYHVVSGANALSGSLSDQQSVTTLNGDITININGENVSITDGSGGSSNVIVTDLQCRNGVIHLIDRVLLPQ